MKKRLVMGFVVVAIILSFCHAIVSFGKGQLIARANQDGLALADIVVESGQNTLTWAAVPNATSYEIYRAKSRLSEYELVINTTLTKYTDTSPNESKYENYYKIVALNGTTKLDETIVSLELKLFGSSMKFYDSKYDNIQDIENEINKIHDEEMFGGVGGEFSSKRYALLLKPGIYEGFERFQVGFYTQLAGLGATPSQTRIYGSVETPPHLNNNNATCTFWRSIENLQISSGRFDWGVSQAAPLRRMKVDVPTQFDWKGGWASGGFSADCDFNFSVGSGSQQQWYARNCEFSYTLGNTGGYNHVVQGSTGSLPKQNFENGGTFTVLDNTPIIREKPFVYLDVNGNYKVFVPSLREEAVGLSWTDSDMGEGESLDLVNDFFIAREGKVDAKTLNEALNRGKHIFFTPGRYELDEPLLITRANTVVMGLGLATLIPSQKNIYGAIYIEDVGGVTVAGLMLDALYDSKYLICAGGNDSFFDHSDNPTLLSDLFLRVGGYKSENVNADISALINSNNIIGDHFWVWRADHGKENSKGIGWNKNTAPNGMIVAGDDVTFYGLFVEHYQEYQTLWLGERGRTYFYQCELPYDPTNQEVYKSHNGTVDGYAAYKVANSVQSHQAIGMGIYAVFNRTGENRDKSESVFIENAIEVPNCEGVTIKHVRLTDFSSEGGEMTGMRSVINGAGNGVSAGKGTKTTANAYIVSYNNGLAVTPSSNKTGIQPQDEEFVLPTDLIPMSSPSPSKKEGCKGEVNNNPSIFFVFMTLTFLGIILRKERI